MTNGEKTEVALIPVVGGLVWWWASVSLPEWVGIGRIVLGASALLLLQSLVRDLWLLSRSRVPSVADQRSGRCLCLESSIGMLGVLFGALALSIGFEQRLNMTPTVWAVTAMAVLTTGYVIKDFVVSFDPFGVHRDPEHMNIIVTWRSRS